MDGGVGELQRSHLAAAGDGHDVGREPRAAEFRRVQANVAASLDEVPRALEGFSEHDDFFGSE